MLSKYNGLNKLMMKGTSVCRSVHLNFYLMKKSSFAVFAISFTAFFSSQTVRVIDNKGTVKLVDQSKWQQNGNNIINRNSGNVGIGTNSPSAKLEINTGTTAGAIKIVDGTQGTNKILVSDANGVGTWQQNAAMNSTVMGVFPDPSSNVYSGGTADVKYTGVYIDLEKGKWNVNGGISLTCNINNKNTKFWLHAYLSTSQTAIQQNGFTHLGPAGNATCYAGNIFVYQGGGDDNKLNFFSGSSVINVTSNTLRIYLLLENRPNNYWQYQSFFFENYFNANPVN